MHDNSQSPWDDAARDGEQRTLPFSQDADASQSLYSEPTVPFSQGNNFPAPPFTQETILPGTAIPYQGMTQPGAATPFQGTTQPATVAQTSVRPETRPSGMGMGMGPQKK